MRQMLIAGLIGAGIGAAIVWYGFPTHNVQTETKTQVVTEYRIRTREQVVERPDGTKVTRRTIVDNGKQLANSSTASKSTKVHDWMLGVTVGSNLQEFTPIYGFRLERRIIGPVFAGAYITTNKEVGISLGLEF